MQQTQTLLAPILYVEREALADFLSGALIRLARFTRDQCDVLRALVFHRGWHSNRVWASQARLAELSKTSPATVKRTVAGLKKLGVEVLRGEALAGGPGPHLYPKKKKLGEWEVNCYDLSRLAELLPVQLVRIFQDLLMGVLDARDQQAMEVLEHQSWDPFADGLERGAPVLDVPPAPGAAAPASDEEVLLASPPAGVPLPAPPTERGAPGSSLSKSTSDSAMSNVDKRNVKTGAGERQNGADSGPSARIFRGSILSRKRNKRVCRLSDALELVVSELKKRGGIDEPVGRRMVLDKGVDWCKKLLMYGQRMEIADGVKRGGGWYHETWQNFDGWPDFMDSEFKRDEQAKRIAAEASKEAQEMGNAQARQPISRPVSASTLQTPPVVPDSALVSSEGLDIGPGLRALIRKHGEANPIVQAALKAIKRGGNDGA